MASLTRVMAHMALTAVVIGTAAAVISTGRVTLSLVASGALCWSFVPALQVLTGLLFVRGADTTWLDALARYFNSGRYWSTWILGGAAVLLLAPAPGAIVFWLLPTAIVPLALTARALAGLRRELAGETGSAARRRVALHQAATIVLIVAYAMWATALWPRLFGLGNA